MHWRPAIGWRGSFPIRWASALLLLPWLLVPGALARDRGADGSFEKRESSHFVLFQDVAIDETGGLRGSRRFEQLVLDELEDGYDGLDQFLGLRPPRKLVVWVYAPQVFDRAFASRFGFQPVGVFDGAMHVRSGDRMTLQLSQTLHHELVHAAFAAVAPSLLLPAWFNEGMAKWYEQRVFSKRRLSRGQLQYLAQARQQGALFPISALSSPNFAGFDQNAATLAYLQSYGMIEYLARRHGERSVREFCVHVMRSGDIERSMHRIYRFGVRDLEARFAADL